MRQGRPERTGGRRSADLAGGCDYRRWHGTIMPNPSVSTLRIIGGQWRSRRVEIATADGLRPTPDRVRETLFNWLAPRIEGARCLDLFAGTGALGLEALSRGAAQVTFIE